MSRRLKGTTMSLADFAGDVAKEVQLLPSESKGLERQDLPKREPRREDSRRFRNEDEDTEGGKWRREPSRREPHAEGEVMAPSKADETDNWWGSRTGGPSVVVRSEPKAESRVEEEISWRRAPVAASPVEEVADWRSAPRAAPAPAPGDERPAHLRNLRERLAAARGGAAPAVEEALESKPVAESPKRFAEPLRTVESSSRPVEASSRFAFDSEGRSSAFASMRKRGDERPAFGGDRPAFGGDRPAFGGDRPAFGGDRISAFSTDRTPAPAPERPSIFGRRPARPLSPVKDTSVPEKKPVKPAAAPVSWEEEEEVVVAVDPEKLSGFLSRLKVLLADESKKIESFAKKAVENFTTPELATGIPLSKALEALVDACRQKTLEEAIAITKRCSCLFRALQLASTESTIASNPVTILLCTQRYSNSIDYPRLSPETSLLEAVWLGLYECLLIPSETFTEWSSRSFNKEEYLAEVSDCATDYGKSGALFQTLALRQWIDGKFEGTAPTTTATSWSDDEEDVDAELESYLSQTLSRKGGLAGFKKTVAVTAARR